jgi:uncharacterized protein (DUF1697 family)
MPRYALLIRGINVGGRSKLAMSDLRELLTGLGCRDVRTHLQSGNAVFASPQRSQPALAARIEQAIGNELGLSVRCLTRNASELRSVIEGNPFSGIATEGSRFLALFLAAEPDSGLLAANDPCALAPAYIRLGDRVIYQWCPDGILQAPNVSSFVERKLKVAVTGRNWNTVTKLGELMS